MRPVVLAGLLTASCVAHGGQDGGPKTDAAGDLGLNHVSHSPAFFERLLPGRVWIFSRYGGGRASEIVQGLVFSKDGRQRACFADASTTPKWVADSTMRWGVVQNKIGAILQWKGPSRRAGLAGLFYSAETGSLANEIRVRGEKRVWLRTSEGWLQDSWPRSLATACPNLPLPSGLKINERQTSLGMDELRRQDPDAPIRYFPGSTLTAPGRSGVGGTNGAPTTTKEEVWAFLDEQEGNILLNPGGGGRVFVRGPGTEHEIWRVDADGGSTFFHPVRETTDERGEWLDFVDRRGRVRFRYPMGYPFPYLLTGHRHAAFQLTDKLIGHPYPRLLPFMGEAYADRRFVFHGEGKFSVVDEAGNLVEGPHFEGGWRWTRGRLEMTVTDDPAGPRSIGWRDLADQLDMKPSVWTRSTPDRY